jgi:hypothetical protein
VAASHQSPRASQKTLWGRVITWMSTLRRTSEANSAYQLSLPERVQAFWDASRQILSTIGNVKNCGRRESRFLLSQRSSTVYSLPARQMARQAGHKGSRSHRTSR